MPAELLGKLGIDIKLLMAQIINFGLLVVILKKFLYAPIIKRIEEDEKKLTEAKHQKELLEKEREELENYKDKTIKESHDKAKHIIEEAQEISKKIKEREEKEAKAEKEKVIKQINERLEEVKR
jgi:F-type H+-transporting ATPase subunit b